MKGELDRAKRQLRLQTRTRLAEVRPADAGRWSLDICRALAVLPEFRRASTVMAFLAISGEPDLAVICDEAIDTGKRLCLPRVDWESRTMVAALVGGGEGGLIAGRHGLREPGPEAPVIPPGQVDLVLVPGLAFDESGRRLGRGAGYYDRFLAALSVAPIGVAFELQLVPEVPAAAHDVPMSAIVTERRVIRVQKPGTPSA